MSNNASVVDERPKLTVYLPSDMEREIYADFLLLARKAVDEVSEKVTINTRYLNQKQLADYFNCGIPVIKQWQAKGLKSFMKGKEITFDMKDVEQFLDTQKY